MRYKLRVGLAIAATTAGILSLGAQPASADYAPSSKDVVGVGSGVMQYATDFAADGDQLGDPGYNSAGNKYKLVNFDATADANERVDYGPLGVGTGACTPGLGATIGTGIQTTTHTDLACTLNPTIVIRAGLSPVQRPDGSQAGAWALAGDTRHFITFARAATCEGPTCTSGGAAAPGPLSAAYDSVEIGTDPLAMLAAKSTNAVALSKEQLASIYSCTDTTWTQVGGTSGDTIIPLLPQLGSETRATFLADIGNPTVGSCVTTVEDNDPTAIAVQADPADAIEPISNGLLDLFLGLLSSGASNGLGGYFTDPSCPLQDVNSSTPAACAPGSEVITPSVRLFTSGSPSDGNPLFDAIRPLYIYFRAADVTSATGWQPGSTLNPIRTLFYNPCPDNPPVAGDGCTTVGSTTYGPGGPPWIATTAAQADIAAAGITPQYVVTIGGP
jgi:hypothetical protein